MMAASLSRSFYLDPDVAHTARSLLGKVLVTRFNGIRTSGVITETEAYAGVHDRASHAYGGRRTTRTETMYAQGGTAYVYLCYGIHHLFNVVTHEKDEPYAVLVRAIRPMEGKDVMRSRRSPARMTTNGPGTLSQALGIRTEHSGSDLLNGPIQIEEHGITIPDTHVIQGPRIGVDHACDDALLPYRFRIAPSHPIPGAD